jgi:hypothetical protein
MFGFFRKKATAAPDSTPPSQLQDSDSRLPTEMLRESVRLVLAGLLRDEGMPLTWLSCTTTTTIGTNNSRTLKVRITVNCWHDAMMLHLPLLESDFRSRLERFEPAAKTSVLQISWQFLPGLQIPRSALPDRSVWTSKPEEVSESTKAVSDAIASFAESASAAPAAKPKFDLPESEMDRRGKPSQAFAATEPSPLYPSTEPNQLR